MNFDIEDPGVAQSFQGGLASFPKAEYAICTAYDQDPKYPELNFNRDLEYVVKYSHVLNQEIIEESQKIQKDLLYAFKFELRHLLAEKGKLSVNQSNQLKDLFKTEKKDEVIKKLTDLSSKHKEKTLPFLYCQIDNLFKTGFSGPKSPDQKLDLPQVEALFRRSREVRYVPTDPKDDKSGWEVRIGPLLRDPQINVPYRRYLVKYTGQDAEKKAKELVDILLIGIREPFLHQMKPNKRGIVKESMKDNLDPDKLSLLQKTGYSWLDFTEPENIVFAPPLAEKNVPVLHDFSKMLQQSLEISREIPIPPVTKEDLTAMAKDLGMEDKEGNIVPIKNAEKEFGWVEFLLDFADKLYTAGIAPYADETATEDLEDAQKRWYAFYRDFKLSRLKAWGDAFFALKKYPEALEQYDKVIHFPLDVQHLYPLYFFEAYFNRADCLKILGFIKNDPEIVEQAIAELKEFPLGKSNNLGYQARAAREIALLYQALLEWEYRSKPLQEIHKIKKEIRKYLALSLYLNERKTKSKNFKYNEKIIKKDLQREKFFIQPSVETTAKLTFNLPQDIMPNTSIKWFLLDEEDMLIANGKTQSGIIKIDLARHIEKPPSFKNEYLFSAYYENQDKQRIQFSRAFLIDPDKKGKTEMIFSEKYPKSKLIGQFDKTGRKTEEGFFDINYEKLKEKWNYRTQKGEVFEVAKTLIQMGDLYLNLSAEEEEFLDDQAKENHLKEAEKWFNMLLEGPGQRLFTSTVTGCTCRNNLLSHSHKPKEFYLYRARAYYKLGDTQRRRAYITDDLETITESIKNLEKALKLMSKFKGNAPSDFSIYNWIERHTYFEIRAVLASAYNTRISINTDRLAHDLKRAEEVIFPAMDNLDLIEDINVKLMVMLTLFETRLYRQEKMELKKEITKKLDEEITKKQSDIEEMLQGRAGGNSFLYNTYFKILEDFGKPSLYFNDVICTGSGYPYLRCKIDKIHYKSKEPEKVIEDAEKLSKQLSKAPRFIKLKLLDMWAKALSRRGNKIEASKKNKLAQDILELLPDTKVKNRPHWQDELEQRDKRFQDWKKRKRNDRD